MTQQDLLDVKVTAFEGGINYWAQIREVPGKSKRDEELNYVGPWQIVEVGDFTDPEDFRTYTLTDAALRKGIGRAAEHYGRSVQAFIENHDAEYADVAVQFALFGEIVYG